jgi:hypothetical protein
MQIPQFACVAAHGWDFMNMPQEVGVLVGPSANQLSAALFLLK